MAVDYKAQASVPHIKQGTIFNVGELCTRPSCQNTGFERVLHTLLFRGDIETNFDMFSLYLELFFLTRIKF